MLITLRLPRSSARRLNLAVSDVDQGDVITTLAAVELAGRLSLTTGKAISPKAVVRYCVAWQAATDTLHRLTGRHGEAGLARMVRKACKGRALWAPRGNAAMLGWLQCVLEVHFLSGGEWQPEMEREVTPSAEQQTGDKRLLTEPQVGHMLADICEANFPQAHPIWSQGTA